MNFTSGTLHQEHYILYFTSGTLRQEYYSLYFIPGTLHQKHYSLSSGTLHQEHYGLYFTSGTLQQEHYSLYFTSGTLHYIRNITFYHVIQKHNYIISSSFFYIYFYITLSLEQLDFEQDHLITELSFPQHHFQPHEKPFTSL